MDRLFLDANVLFSAAYRRDAGLRALWSLPGARLLTSTYAAEEARRNLDEEDQRRDLERLLSSMEVLPPDADDFAAVAAVPLRAKDRPIVRAALGARATHLVTGDRRDFGPWFGRRLMGIRVVSPADCLRDRTAEE